MKERSDTIARMFKYNEKLTPEEFWEQANENLKKLKNTKDFGKGILHMLHTYITKYKRHEWMTQHPEPAFTYFLTRQNAIRVRGITKKMSPFKYAMSLDDLTDDEVIKRQELKSLVEDNDTKYGDEFFSREHAYEKRYNEIIAELIKKVEKSHFSHMIGSNIDSSITEDDEKRYKEIMEKRSNIIANMFKYNEKLTPEEFLKQANEKLAQLNDKDFRKGILHMLHTYVKKYMRKQIDYSELKGNLFLTSDNIERLKPLSCENVFDYAMNLYNLTDDEVVKRQELQEYCVDESHMCKIYSPILARMEREYSKRYDEIMNNRNTFSNDEEED